MFCIPLSVSFPLPRLEREKENIIQAIKDGVAASLVKDELENVSMKIDELAKLMKNRDDEPRPLIHPTMARRYRKEIVAPQKALSEQQSGEAREHVCKLIEKIVLTPRDNRDDLAIDLYGDLAGILRIATEDKKIKDKGNSEKRLARLVANDNYSGEPSVQLVAGVGFEPTTFGL